MNEQQPKQRFPTWKQALLILCSGIVLGLSSCAAFLATISSNSSDNLSAALATGFGIGVVTSLVGLVLVLIRAIRGPGVRKP